MFRLCASNCAFTDLKCSVCEKWYCEIFCASCCLMCGEFVCNDCYKDEKCCATGERGSTEIHLERFYGEKLRKDVFNNMGMQKRQSKWENVRKKMMLKVVERVVDGELQFDFDFDLYGVNAFADCFCLLLEEENRRTDCLEFIKKLKRDNMLLFSVIMAQIDDCDLLDDLLSQKTIDINFLAGYAIKHKEGEKLFNLLKERKLLDFRAVEGKVRSVRHLSAFKWLESNGMDVTRDEDLFEALVHNHCVDIWEYLITERGLTTEMLLSQRFGYYKLNLDLAKVLFRLKGLEELQKVEVKKFVFTYEMVKWLISIGYHFEKEKLLTIEATEELYWLLSFDLLRMSDLKRKNDLLVYLRKRDLKVCKNFLPYFKPVRKKKIFTFLLCVRKIYGKQIPQEIIFHKIIDYAFSPVEERD